MAQRNALTIAVGMGLATSTLALACAKNHTTALNVTRSIVGTTVGVTATVLAVNASVKRDTLERSAGTRSARRPSRILGRVKSAVAMANVIHTLVNASVTQGMTEVVQKWHLSWVPAKTSSVQTDALDMASVIQWWELVNVMQDSPAMTVAQRQKRPKNLL